MARYDGLVLHEALVNTDGPLISLGFFDSESRCFEEVQAWKLMYPEHEARAWGTRTITVNMRQERKVEYPR